jgi:hypothetical protein
LEIRIERTPKTEKKWQQCRPSLAGTDTISVCQIKEEDDDLNIVERKRMGTHRKS